MATSLRKLQFGAAAASFLLVSLLVLRVSSAAFTAQTPNENNAWSAGQVALSDSRGSGNAMFDVSGMVPGQTVSRCINVTYTGTASNARVRLYAPTVTGTLASHLNVTVTPGSFSSHTYPNCTGFTASGGAAVNGMALNTFGATHGSFANGVANWDTSGSPQSRGYRFDVTLSSGAPSSAQGTSAGATFTWEVQTYVP
ncbi:MAG TPA: hypothetical protein VM307_16300 [Egibacteraceae bacterium]|nr:hypothetical protein [Egibacteraceae bacterium]